MRDPLDPPRIFKDLRRDIAVSPENGPMLAYGAGVSDKAITTRYSLSLGN